MTDRKIVLVGGPDSGKTNFLARLWEAIRSGNGTLVASELPPDIKYVENALAHLLQGTFAPRTDTNFDDSERSLSIPVELEKSTENILAQIVVPDVSGELWKEAVETCELPSQWMDNLKEACGALLFVRIGSDLNHDPLDWVTAAEILKMDILQTKEDLCSHRQIPTAVQLCELVRFLEYVLSKKNSKFRPRVAILVTAWDRLDEGRAALGPKNYLAQEFPLLSGQLADMSRLNVQVFGMSIVGGDFIEEKFKQEFLDGELNKFGYVVYENEGSVKKEHDVALPVKWILNGQIDT